MIIHNARFVGSYVKTSQCPEPKRPEYAFIGRSNVGKSSLINMLMDQRKLAKVSGTPGKTQTLNYFLINDDWYLVDLPGYGYAKVSKTQRQNWQKMIRDFLAKRSSLACVFVLVDARISPQQADLDFTNWLGELRIPFVLAFTKADKLKAREVQANIEAFQQAMLQHWHSLPQHFITSAKSRQGKKELLDFIAATNQKLATAS